MDRSRYAVDAVVIEGRSLRSVTAVFHRGGHVVGTKSRRDHGASTLMGRYAGRMCHQGQNGSKAPRTRSDRSAWSRAV